MPQQIILTPTNTNKPTWRKAKTQCPPRPLMTMKANQSCMLNGLRYLCVSQLQLQILINLITTPFNKSFSINTRIWHAGVKGSSSITGFKKALYNRVKVRNVQLHPAYNRRKHGHNHYNLILHQIKRLSKTFGYVSNNKIHAWIGLTLTKFAHNVHYAVLTAQPLSMSALALNLLAHQVLRQKNSTYLQHTMPAFFTDLASNQPELRSNPGLGAVSRPRHGAAVLKSAGVRTVPNLVALIESESCTTLWRNQYYGSLNATKQALRHRRFNCHDALLIHTNLYAVGHNKVHINHDWLKAGEVFRKHMH